MIVAKTKDALAAQILEWKTGGQRIGFVPTMGALHAGHLSLCDVAAAQCDRLVMSIFVNPAQFAAHEDLDLYPRTLEADLEKLTAQGLVDLVYAPREEDIYPDGAAATLKAGAAALGLESDFRPHFFDGVVSVVYRLFEQVQPDCAVFGEKDYQQLKVIEEMVRMHALKVRIIGGEIVRDEHGLALSSRNAYLSEGEIEIARLLNQVIYNIGHAAPDARTEKMTEGQAMLLECGFDRVDYIAERWGRILAAVWLGKTRLIDNCPVFA